MAPQAYESVINIPTKKPDGVREMLTKKMDA